MARSCVLLPCLVLALTLAAGEASADRWPLQAGWNWTYHSESYNSDQYSEVFAGTRMVRGVECIVLLKEYDQMGGLQRVLHFLTKNGEGDVWMHGWEDLDDGRQVSFDPPLLLLDQPMVAGAVWKTRVTPYQGLDEGGEAGPYFIESYEVVSDMFFTFEFGTRQAYGVSRDLWVAPQADAGPAARWSSPAMPAAGKGTAVLFFSEECGVVLEYSYWLTRYAGSVAAEQSTWSDLKGSFR